MPSSSVSSACSGTRDWMKSVARVGIEAGGEPVDEHLPHRRRDVLGRLVVRRQRVPVGREEQALVLLLQAHPVPEGAVVMADVHAARRAHARQHAVSEHERSSFFVALARDADDLDAGQCKQQEREYTVNRAAGPSTARPGSRAAQGSRRIRTARGATAASAARCGSRPTAMRPPSSGGIGSRFSAISTRLILTPASAICMQRRRSPTVPPGPAAPSSSAHTTAMTKFASRSRAPRPRSCRASDGAGCRS